MLDALPTPGPIRGRSPRADARSRSAVAGALALVLVLVAWPGAAARAGFDAEGFELFDVSAWTLRDGELYVAPDTVRIGLFDVVELGSAWPLDGLGAINADLAVTLHSGRYVAFGARAGFIFFDPAFVGIDTDFDVVAFPLAFEVSGRPHERVRVHGSIAYLSARPDAQAPDGALRIQRYLGPVGRLAATLGGEYRFNGSLGVLLELELPLIAHRPELRYADEGAGFGDHVKIEAAMHLVAASFNLRVGVGWGPSVFGKTGVFPILGLGLRIF